MYLHLNEERAQAAQIAEILRGPKPEPTEPGTGLVRALEALNKCAVCTDNTETTGDTP